MTRSVTCLAIAGGTCSGKSALAGALQDRLGKSECAVLRLDNFYRPQTEEDVISGAANLDQPGAFDFEQFVATFHSLRDGHDVEVPAYDRKSMQSQRGVVIEARNTLAVEGLFVLHDPRIYKFLKLAIFLDIDVDIQLARRLNRDIQENGMSREYSLLLFNRDVMPGFEQYILPTRQRAHLTLLGNEDIDSLVDKVILRIMEMGQ